MLHTKFIEIIPLVPGKKILKDILTNMDMAAILVM